MKIVWDEPKRKANLEKHGLDFVSVDLAFFASATIRPAHSGRFLAIGRLAGGHVVAAVFKPLGTEALSLISLRSASETERSFL